MTRLRADAFSNKKGVNEKLFQENNKKPDVVVVTGATLIEVVVALVLQAYVVAPPPVNVVEAPLQVVGELTVVTGTGFTVTVVEADAVHPPGNVIITV